MQRKVYRSLFFWGLIFLLSLSFPTGATSASKSGYVEVVVVPKAHIFADGNPMTLKPKGKTKLIVDVGLHTIGAELDGYLMENKSVDVLPGKKYKVVLALLKTGQNRDAMASISGGTVTMGVDKERVDWIMKRIGGKLSDFANAVPSSKVKLKDYKIDKYEVSNVQYQKFVKATKRKAPKHWNRGKVSIEMENYPVVNVSYSDAVAYCKWKGKRLPTEAEWEYAARGNMEHIFPWGKKFRDGRANLRESAYRRPTDTGRYAKGVAKFSGCYDMSGNAWEWTSSWYNARPGSNHKDKDYGKSMKVIRGGSFRVDRAQITSVFRGKLAPDTIQDDMGFRCAK
jgi:formylglycine-generating enzyme required for sulfatase activity